MLLELRIENLLLIERAELRLGPELNAITGETGAGKTILAHSFDLLMGGKARPQIVRPGAAEAYVEGVFELPEGLLSDPELAPIGERLPEAGAQLETLDGFAGDQHLQRRDKYRAAHAEVIRIERELAVIREREGAREQDLDILRYELEEIEAAKPDPAEEAELATERERLRHAEALRIAAAEALSAVIGDAEDAGGGASAAIGAAEAALAAQSEVDPKLDELAERTRGARVELQEIAAELRGYADGIEVEPGRLEQVEERLEALDRLKRKHGGPIEAGVAPAG